MRNRANDLKPVFKGRDFRSATKNISLHIWRVMSNLFAFACRMTSISGIRTQIWLISKTRSQAPVLEKHSEVVRTPSCVSNVSVVSMLGGPVGRINLRDLDMGKGDSTDAKIHFQPGEASHLVFLHAYFEDEAVQLAQEIRQFEDAHVIVTASDYSCVEKLQGILDPGLTHYLLTENRGRDILPFLVSLSCLDLTRYEVFTKIHTKKSTHLGNGDVWRNLLVESILHKDSIGQEWLKTVRNSNLPQIGGYEAVSTLDHHRTNRKWMNFLFTEEEIRNSKFIAGTMFLGNAAFLASIIQANLLRYRFERENGQLDGCLAHAIERGFGIITLRNGGSVVGLLRRDWNWK